MIWCDSIATVNIFSFPLYYHQLHSCHAKMCDPCCIYWVFPTRMVYLYNDICLRYTILVGNPQYSHQYNHQSSLQSLHNVIMILVLIVMSFAVVIMMTLMMVMFRWWWWCVLQSVIRHEVSSQHWLPKDLIWYKQIRFILEEECKSNIWNRCSGQW